MLQAEQQGGSVVLRGVGDTDLAEVARRSARLSILILLVLVCAAALLKCRLWFHVPIGHDEFNCLQIVHRFIRGEHASPFQSLHVHFFSWLGAVSENEVVQLMSARAVMLVLLLGTCVFLFLLGMHLLGPLGALFSVLCYLSLSYTVRNGATFRTDTPATFLFMLALYGFVVRKGSIVAGVGAGLAMALSCLFTIKASLYGGTFVVLSLFDLFHADDFAGVRRRLFTFVLSFILGALVVYRIHAATFPPTAPGYEARFFQASFSTFMFFRYFPEPGFLVPTLLIDTATWLLLLVGLAACLHGVIVKRGADRTTDVCLLAMFIPVLSLAFFRNTAGYFYVFILPSAMLLCGHAADLLRRRVDRGLPRMSPLCMGVLALTVAHTYAMWPRFSDEAVETTAAQRQLLSAIHTTFPDPVPYIDGCRMVASFPNAGFFMSSACMTPYLRAGRPVLKDSLHESKPLFLLANVPHLDLHSERPPKSMADLALLEEDWAAMRSYFVHHWGPLWVLGKQIHLTPDAPLQPFEITVAGTYTLESPAQVRIDGRLYRDGDTLKLEQGSHAVEGAEGTVTLRWGSHLYRPPQPPPVEDLFMGKLG